MKRSPAPAIAAALALWLVAGPGCAHRAPAPPAPPPAAPPTVPPPLEPTEVIRLTSLGAGEVVTSPLVVEGSARGNWFFEGRFPVSLVDQDGHELAQAAAHAQGDWTSAAFVPFSATLFFKVPPGVTAGSLIFRNDNPSGIRELEREKRVLVRFVPGDAH